MSMQYNNYLIDKLRGKTVLIKYGGNAMVNNELKDCVLNDVCELKSLGVNVVMVHGGGPSIKALLEKVGIESEFIDGHRKTTQEALRYIEMALKGEVNGELVRLLNNKGQLAVGLSGKDAKMVLAVKRDHIRVVDGKEEAVDLNQVGDVDDVDTKLINGLISKGFLPVVATVATGGDGMDYNINADMFAGHLAGALNAEAYISMTDVKGLMTDVDDKQSFISEIDIKGVEKLKDDIIKGGMIPKIDSCLIALDKGVATARIINGTEKGSILKELLTDERSGTLINGM